MPKSYHDDLGDLDPTPLGFDTQVKYDRIDDASNFDDISNLDSSIDDVELVSKEVPLRRGTRVHQSSIRYPSSEYIVLIDEGEIEYYQKAVSGKLKMEWLKAM